MGYALIVGGGTDGRYTIEIDIGEAERIALVEKFTERAAEAQAKLAAAQVTLAEKQALLDAAALAYEAATVAYIEVLRNEGDVQDEDAYIEIVNAYPKAQAEYLSARVAHFAALANRNALSLSATTITKALSAWQAQVLTETRDAWCTDFTEDATGYVATMEIPGESDLILLAPGGRPPVLATDGQLFSRALMSPWQAYFNAAVLPGWQKFKPTYRWGTITALDDTSDTADVDLFDSKSSAQRLPVNQAQALQSVAVEYMDAGASVFEIGDNVVVEFQNQDWGSPKVIGFVDNPRPPGKWDIWNISFDENPDVYFAVVGFKAKAAVTFSDMYSAASSDILIVKMRINGGAWVLLSKEVSSGSIRYINTALPELLWAVLGLSFFYAGGQNVTFWLHHDLASAGDIIEVLCTEGDTIWLNSAVQNGNNAFPLSIALTGKIISNDGAATLRLDYDLYERTGL